MSIPESVAATLTEAGFDAAAMLHYPPILLQKGYFVGQEYRAGGGS